MTEKDGGHQTPTQPFLPPRPLSVAEGKQFNKIKKTVPEIAVMPAMMSSPGPSNHLILTKSPAHTEEQISWRCSVVGSV